MARQRTKPSGKKVWAEEIERRLPDPGCPRCGGECVATSRIVFRKSCERNTRRAAEEWKAEREREVDRAWSEHVCGLSKSIPLVPLPTLDEFVVSFWGMLRETNAKRSSIYHYGSKWRWLQPHVGSLRLDELTRPVVMGLREKLRAAGMKAEPVIAMLSSLCSWAIACYPKQLESNPCAMVRGRRRAENRRKKPPAQVWTPEEAESVRELLPLGRERIAILLALECGMRKSEARGVYRSDFHLDALPPHVNICHTYTIVGSEWVESGTKSGEERDTPIPPRLVQELRWWVGKQGRTPRLLDREDGQPVSFKGSSSRVHKLLQETADAAGVKRIRYQDLRATFVTNELARGVPKAIVKVMIGHSGDDEFGLGLDVTDESYNRIGLEEMARWAR